ncbi:hypothetical protein CK203_071643 [Vitis vinifera]|uniref:Uncharacterized protein n=1 Tax=Vitis vinifera TaxID=29760 RepID=A0A438F467_VITVI|nr:hypothetical protein CK203_071643 [Vitis vinifera]
MKGAQGSSPDAGGGWDVEADSWGGATHGLSSRDGWVAPRASGYGAYARRAFSDGPFGEPCGPGGLPLTPLDHVGPKEWVDFRRPRSGTQEGVGLVAEGPSVETSLHSNVAQICGPSRSRNPALKILCSGRRMTCAG